MTKCVAICCCGGCNITVDSFSKDGGNDVVRIWVTRCVSARVSDRGIHFVDGSVRGHPKGLSNNVDTV